MFDRRRNTKTSQNIMQNITKKKQLVSIMVKSNIFQVRMSIKLQQLDIQLSKLLKLKKM